MSSPETEHLTFTIGCELITSSAPKKTRGEKSKPPTETAKAERRHKDRRKTAMDVHNRIPYAYDERSFLSLRFDKRLDPVGSKDLGKCRAKLNRFADNMLNHFPGSLFFGKLEQDKDGETFHAHVDFYPGENVTLDEVTQASRHYWTQQANSQWQRLVDVKQMCPELVGYFFSAKKKTLEKRFIQKFPGKSFWMMKGFQNLTPTEPEQIQIPMSRKEEAGEILVEDYRRKMKEAGKPEKQSVINNLRSGFARYFMPSEEAKTKLRALVEPATKGENEMGLFVNQKGAAEYLGMNYHSFRKLIRDYPIPKHGPKRNYFKKEELLEWMENPNKWTVKDSTPESKKQGKIPSFAEQLDACTGPGTNTWGNFFYGLTG